MSKPDGIPQDVWDIATEIVADLECERVPYYDMSGAIAVARHNDTLSISNAILKSRQDALETAAVFCEATAEMHAGDYLVGEVVYELAQQIRSLSQPQKAEQE